MAKVTINGTSGLVAYKANNTTVEVAYTPSELVGIKPSVFKSASPFVIAGGTTIDATTYPSIIKYPDGTENILLNREPAYVTKSSEYFGEGDQNHTFPTGILAGDLLIMCQSIGTRTTDGYSPPSQTPGTGFTDAVTDVAAQWYWRPGGQYDIVHKHTSYKIATGSESGATIGGFCSSTSNVSTPSGYRTLYVYRVPYPYTSVVTSLATTSIGATADTSFPSHTHTTTINGEEQYGIIGVVQHASSAAGSVPTVSGGVTGFDATASYSIGSYSQRQIFSGSFSSKAPTSSITTSGPSNSTAADGILTTVFIPTP